MTGEQIRKLVGDYFARTLAQSEDSRADGVGVLRDHDDETHGGIVLTGEHGVLSSVTGLELHLSDLQEDFAKGEHGNIEHVADLILEEAGIEVARDSHDYRKLCREALRAAIEGAKVEIERMRGDYSSDSRPATAQRSAQRSAQRGAQSEVPEERDDGEPLSKLIREYVQEGATGGRWRGRTKSEVEGCLSLLLRIVGRDATAGEPPDRGIKTITRRDLISFRETLTRWPSNATKAKKYRGKSVAKVLEIADAPFLSPTTINKYLVFAGSLMRWAVANGYTETDYSKGLSISKRNVKPSEEKEAYDREDLLRLIQSPLSQFREARPERFFIPWVAAYSGMRLAEMAQLHLSDIKEMEGVPVFDVNVAEDKALKTVSSRRIVPIHPVLIELGLLEYVEGLRGRGEARLWPLLKKTQTGYGQDFGRFFQRWNRQHITAHPKKTLHSMRHSFSTSLKRALVPETIIAELNGHSHGSIDLDRYGGRFEVRQLLEAVEKVEYGIEEELRNLPRLD
jgi:integrase